MDAPSAAMPQPWWRGLNGLNGLNELEISKAVKGYSP